ncbi:MAG: ABC transporter substrate-binding protein [Candidatus Cloacimonetes bacterium]|nr:ABC transporter substrate-binding protein [Candidatus Cloacimonadota bacterium]
MRRKAVWSGIILALALAGIFSACGEARQSERVQVVFWHSMGGPLGDALNQLIDEFNQAHPDIHILGVAMGNYTALQTKLMASIQADKQPDIAQAFESWIANFIEANKLASMDQFIAADPEFRATMDDIYPVFLRSNTFRDTLWAFPFNKSVRVLYYNKDLFFNNGLRVGDRPADPPATWEEFREYCRILTRRNDKGVAEVYGTTYPVSAWQFENLLLQAGGEIMAEDNRTPLFNSEYGVEALDFLAGLLNADSTAYLSVGYEGQNDFLAGKVAMVEGSSVSVAYMRRTGIDFLLGIGAIPTHRTKRNIISGTNVIIFRKGNPRVEQAAWEFVKWFTAPAQTARWSEMTYYMPVRRSAFAEPALVQRLNEYPEMRAVYEQLEHATYEPPIPQWLDARKHLEEQVIEKVLRGQVAPAAALDAAAAQIEQDLQGTRGEGTRQQEGERSYLMELMVLLAGLILVIALVMVFLRLRSWKR